MPVQETAQSADDATHITVAFAAATKLPIDSSAATAS
jgi:hypothetical protein